MHPQIDGPCLFTSSFREFYLLALPFSRGGQRWTYHDVDTTVMGNPKASLDIWFSSLRKFDVSGFYPFNTPFLPEWSMSTDHDVDLTVRKDLEYPQIYGSSYFVTVSGSGFNSGTDPMIMVKKPSDVG
jgi:hypothetical protein